MKIAVLYWTMTGHSKKIAKAVAAALGTTALNAMANPTLTDVDLLIFAGGIYGGKSLPGALNYLKTLGGKVKRAALITTSASDKCGQEEAKKTLTEVGIEVIAEHRTYGGFLFLKFRRPNKADIAAAVEFAKGLIAD